MLHVGKVQLNCSHVYHVIGRHVSIEKNRQENIFCLHLERPCNFEQHSQCASGEIRTFDWFNETACPLPCQQFAFHQKEIRYAVRIAEHQQNQRNQISLVINYAGNVFITYSQINYLIFFCIISTWPGYTPKLVQIKLRRTIVD